jgi:hypothetical protein
MTVGNRTFAGKGAREEAAKALNEVILSWANDQTTQVRGKFKGIRNPQSRARPWAVTMTRRFMSEAL